jgi:TRAP-type C4-dicarboxylate transport system substrate-binding protein
VATTQRKQSELANTALLAKLKSQGMVVNAPAQQPFKDVLKAAGFYKDWRAKFGPKAWDRLEKTTGALG